MVNSSTRDHEIVVHVGNSAVGAAFEMATERQLWAQSGHLTIMVRQKAADVFACSLVPSHRQKRPVNSDHRPGVERAILDQIGVDFLALGSFRIA